MRELSRGLRMVWKKGFVKLSQDCISGHHTDEDEDAVENSGMSEVRGADGEGFWPAHAGQDSCPRVAALRHTQDDRVKRKGRTGSQKQVMKAKDKSAMVSLQESSSEIPEVVQYLGTTGLYLGQE